MTLDDIRKELRTATVVPEAALRAAVGHADALAPEIYALADKLGGGVYLLPQQESLLFYGLHVLAAARHRDLYPCLVKLLRQNEWDLDELFPDHASVSMARLMLGVWDGDADALFHMLEHADLQDNSRWTLFDVIARLTFDGRIPRERTATFLDRFESAPLADEDDNCWWSWEDAITRLGLTDLEPALHRVWTKRTNHHQHQHDRDESLAELHRMAANPTDPTPFADNDITAIDDPADALAWITHRAELHEQWRREREAEHGPEPEDLDPAKDVRLTADEQRWLDGFLVSRHVPHEALSFDGLDGFFTALVIGPTVVPPSRYLPELWGKGPDGGPEWDSPEQAEYVLGLLMRHWNAIAARRMAGGPIVPTLDPHAPEDIRGHAWADGFEVGVALADDAWTPLFENRRMAEAVWTILDLAFDPTDRDAKPISLGRRKQILRQLPVLLQSISDFWKNPAAAFAAQQPVRSTKVGRNEPCPCGSGKKYKKCCGSGATVH
jgi:yecA family protein